MDIVGSTALGERLDPEPLRQVMDRYFAVCATSIAEHGGAVEKFIGDAILAVFGATVAREDDALRAVRAASGSLDALRDLSTELTASYQLGLEARCGICSGDVIVITAPGGDFRVVGDPVNTASRLQTAAQPGEILIGADTAAMVHAQVGIEQVTPLRLKGKSRPVPAWRVTGLAASEEDGHGPAPAPLIGRGDELEELRQSLRRVIRRRQVCLVTVLGVPGIGKTRLVREFLGTVPGDQATVMSGRCSAYGRGVTYKPLAEILDSYPRGWAALDQALSADPALGGRAVRTLATIMGQPAARPVGVEEISWAVRHLLDVIAKASPVIMVWEDLHWAEPTLLDLIDDVATWLADAPVLLICVARSELLDSRPSWGGGKPCAMTVELGPLTHEQSATLVSELVMHGDVYPQGYDDVAGRVAAQCDGNPLFAELMLDVFAEIAPSAQIPPTVHALLAARLDQLPGDERQLTEMAAVIGREFTTGVLSAMAQADQIGNAAADELTLRLVRRRIWQRGPGSFRFTQSLLRDTAYTLTPKIRRERWHRFLAELFAAQRGAGDSPPGPDASLTLAYHVEAACLLRRDLRPGDPELPALAGAAADVLITEGMNALTRKDLPASAALLERGRELLPAGDGRHTALALHICDAALGLWDEHRSLAALAAAEAALAGQSRNAATCAIQRHIIALRLGLASPGEVAAKTKMIEADLAADPEDNLSWCRLHQLQAYLHLAAEQAAAADASLRLGLARARAMGDGYEEDRLLCAVCELAQWAPIHVRTGLELCATLAGRFAANRALLAPILVTRAYLTAIGGDLEDARRTLATARAHAGDLHLDLADAAVMEMSGFVESLAGRHDKAEAHYRRALETLRGAAHSPDAATIEAEIARELLAQGRIAAAAAALDRLEASVGDPGPRTRITVAALRGRISSARCCHGEAIGRASEAGELVARTDDLFLAGRTLFDEAVVLRAAGHPERAAETAARALARFEAKGAALPAGEVCDWLSAGAGCSPGPATASPGGGDAGE
jgi:class 3 adenylate cyclase/tetratricopeptide (TPR) repeat protein